MVISFIVVLLVRHYISVLQQVNSVRILVVRRLIYVVSMSPPLFLIRLVPDFHASGIGFLIAALTFCGCIWVNIGGLRMLFDREMAELLGPPEVAPLLVETGALFVGAIFEELFYRWYMVKALLSWLGPAVTVFVSTGAFILHHIVHPKAAVTFRLRDLVTQALMGGGAALAVVMGGSVLPALMAHILFNVLLLGGRYYRLMTVE